MWVYENLLLEISVNDLIVLQPGPEMNMHYNTVSECSGNNWPWFLLCLYDKGVIILSFLFLLIINRAY